jgi:hypothetical protein
MGGGQVKEEQELVGRFVARSTRAGMLQCSECPRVGAIMRDGTTPLCGRCWQGVVIGRAEAFRSAGQAPLAATVADHVGRTKT